MRTLDDTEAGIFDYTEYLDILDSDVLVTAWYNSNNRGLVLEFKNGTLAGYRDVNPFSWVDFKNSSSKGTYYNRNIKHIFPGFSVHPDTVFSPLTTDAAHQSELAEDAPTRSWKVTANVSALVTLNVTGDTLEDALTSFQKRVTEKMNGEVQIDFRSVNNE